MEAPCDVWIMKDKEVSCAPGGACRMEEASSEAVARARPRVTWICKSCNQ